MRLEPVRRARQKTECDQHDIGGDGLLGAGHDLRDAPAAMPGITQHGLDGLNAGDKLLAQDLDRLAIKQELDALFLAVFVVPTRTGHVLLIAPVGAGHGLRALADRRAVAVHRGIPAA